MTTYSDEQRLWDQRGQLTNPRQPDGSYRYGNPADSCTHSERLSAVCEGYEDPTEPLSIRVMCDDCGAHIDVAVQDIPMLDWETD